MKNFKVFAAIAVVALGLFSCDTEVKPAPSVTAPTSVSEVLAGKETTLDFSYTAEGGFKATEVTATGGTAAVTTDGEAGATSGTITVTFTAGSDAGAGSVKLTVTDANDQKEDVTAVFTVAEELTVIRVDKNIDGEVTWETGKTYILGGRITVLNNAVLTIQEGVVVKGEAGAGSNATALMVARGGKLNAAGTAAKPIIFTSIADKITPENVAAGEFASPNLSPDVNGLWGGVIILGKARISASNDNDQDVSEVQIEGIPTSDSNGLYGGTEDADNSGTIRYISIRHGGTNIGSGNEINGLTLGGVGSGTTIEHVEIVGNQDDGIEFFGGTVNLTNAVVWNINDDGIDTDQSWAGTLDNFVVVTPNTSKAHCFELDGPEGSYKAGHIIKNGTIVASSKDGDGKIVRFAEDLINVDDNSIVELTNLFFTKIVEGQDINRVTAAGVKFTGIELNVPASDLATYVNGAVPAGVTAASTPSTGVGADASVLSWTWASKAGAF